MPNGLLYERFHMLNFRGWRSFFENSENLALYGIYVVLPCSFVTKSLSRFTDTVWLVVAADIIKNLTPLVPGV